MEQIVKIFVHQSYFMEKDLVVDYNVQQGVIFTIKTYHQIHIYILCLGPNQCIV